MGYHNAKNDPNDITPVPPGDLRHQKPWTPAAEDLADAILVAAGSGLKHYTMPATRNRIFTVAQEQINFMQKDLIKLFLLTQQAAIFSKLRDEAIATNDPEKLYECNTKMTEVYSVISELIVAIPGLR